jgi:hypothetical protein
MVTKLTLTMDKDVIEKAKEYARGKNKSLSKIVEGYLKRLDSREIPLNLKNLHAPITDSLVGMMGHDDGRDYREVIEEAITEKYLGIGKMADMFASSPEEPYLNENPGKTNESFS